MVIQNPFPNEIKQDFKITPLAGDASTRLYSRIETSTSRFMWMQREPFDSSNDPFVKIQKVLSEHQIPVPQIISMNESSGFMLLEDLGDLSLQDFVQKKSFQSLEVRRFYDDALDILYKLHQISTQHFPLRFDFSKLSWEMDFAIDHVFYRFYKDSLDQVKNCDSITRELHRLAETLALQSEVPTHRDYHSRNLMIKNGALYVIDFQDARMGRSQYDLVSLLGDSYVELPWELEVKWVRQFFDQMPHGKLNWEEYWQMYLLQGIQRGFKACGTFASQWNLKNNDRYLEHLVPTLRRVLFLTKQCPEQSFKLACWLERVLP